MSNSSPDDNDKDGRSDIDLPMQIVDREHPMPPRQKRRLRWFIVVPGLILMVMVSVLAGGIAGLYRQPAPLQKLMHVLGLTPGGGTDNPIAVPVDQQQSGSTAPQSEDGKSASPKPGTVVGLATLVPKGQVSTVAPPSGAGDARISEILVEIGDQVRKSDVIATLDNLEQLTASVENAKARFAVGEAALTKTRVDTEASFNEAKAAVERTRAVAKKTQLDFERTSQLYDRGTVAKSSYDSALAARDQARRDVDLSKATLSRFSYDDINQQTDMVVAIENLGEYSSQLNQAAKNLDQAYVRSPIDGTVLDIYVQPGEKPAQDGVMDIGDIEHMIAQAEIYQSQISDVQVGDGVTLDNSALRQPLTGTVSRIGLQVKKQTIVGADPTSNTDARVVEVDVTLDPESSTRASRFTNLQVTARISISSSANARKLSR